MKKIILILSFMAMLLVSLHAAAQHEIRIQGVVRDITTSQPIAGVVVMYEGNRIATTDIDGNYAAFVPSNAELLFYNPEYNDYTVTVDNRQIININMTVKVIELSEAIVVGKMSKKTIVVDQTELEVIGNYFHLKTKFRVPKQIFTSDKRFIVQPTLMNVTRNEVGYFRPVVMDGDVYRVNRARVAGFVEDEDVLKPYIQENNLAETEHIYSYHDSLFVSREYFNDDFKAECFLAVNANFENPKRDFLDTVVIARGTQNPLRFLDYHLEPMELNDTSLIPKPEMKLVASKGVSKIGFVIGKALIDKSNPQNEVELNAIKEKLNEIVSNRFSTLNSISVIGYASPDGPYRANAILAKNRTDVVLKEIVSSLPAEIQKFIKLSSMSVVEPWSKIIPFMREDSLESADKVQEIVTKYHDDFVNTQSQVRKLPEYKKVIAAEYLPRLRRVEYELNHTEFRNLTVPEIWDRFNSGNEDISRYEFYKLIESCQDSIQKVKMERLALKKFPNFMLIANRESVRQLRKDSVDLNILKPSIQMMGLIPLPIRFNQTLTALKGGDIDLADSLAMYIPTDNSTAYLKAIVNTLNGRYADAYPYLASLGGLNEVLILLCMGRNKEANDKVSKLLEDEANWQNANIWYVKAICANRLDDLSWAIEALQQAIILDPHLIEIARLDSDVMDIIDILVPLEENQPV